jgi:hypothetical protein
LSPNALDINGANTYQFVMSNPAEVVDPFGTTSVELSQSQMRTLAKDIAGVMMHNGRNGLVGSSRTGAEAFLSFEIYHHFAEGLVGQVGHALLHIPLFIAKNVLAPELDLIKEGSKMAAEEAEKLYREWLNKAVKTGEVETYSFAWSSGAKCGVQAKMFFIYFPASHDFRGYISGRVGNLKSIAGEPDVPPEIGTVRPFDYPFSGTANLYQSGWWDLYQWHLNYATGGIVRGSFFYDGNYQR